MAKTVQKMPKVRKIVAALSSVMRAAIQMIPKVQEAYAMDLRSQQASLS